LPAEINPVFPKEPQKLYLVESPNITMKVDSQVGVTQGWNGGDGEGGGGTASDKRYGRPQNLEPSLAIWNCESATYLCQNS